MTSSRHVSVVFDWDKTISPRYMPYVIFDHYGIDEREFWAEANNPARGFKCSELSFLSLLSEYSRPGKPLAGLRRSQMRELGLALPVYPGVEELFRALKEKGIEIYIVSAGLSHLIEDHPVAKLADGVFASSYADEDLSFPSEIITPIEKVRVLYEISKGCSLYGIHPTAEVPSNVRRIPFSHMIYVGDGPSDVWAWQKIINGNGHTVGVWDPNVPAGFDQIERMRKNGKLSFIGMASFHPEKDSTGYWIYNKALELQAFEEREANRTEMEAIHRLKDDRPQFVHPWSLRRMS